MTNVALLGRLLLIIDKLYCITNVLAIDKKCYEKKFLFKSGVLFVTSYEQVLKLNQLKIIDSITNSK